MMDWNALIRLIKEALDGRTLWMNCTPVLEDDSPTEEGVGLAIQKHYGPKSEYYELVFFRLLPEPEALGEDADFLEGRGEEVSDWYVEPGYTDSFDTLAETIQQTKSLARELPGPERYLRPDTLESIIEQVTDPDEEERRHHSAGG